MTKIRIICSNSKKSAVISALHDAEVMQIEPVSQDLSQYLSQSSQNGMARDINEQLQRMRGFESVLPSIRVSKKVSMPTLNDTISQAKDIRIDDEVKMLKNSEEALRADIRDIENRLSVVKVLTHIEYDMSIFNNKSVQSYLVSGIDEGAIASVKERIPGTISVQINDEYHLISVSSQKVQEFAKVSNELSLHVSHIPEVTGKPEEYYESLNKLMQEKQNSISEIRSSLGELAREYGEKILQLREALEIEGKKADLADHLLENADVFAIEGWIPASQADRIEKNISSISDGKYILSKVDTKEEPPTLMNNPKHTRLFEFFIKFYSLPQGTEFDPTVVFAIVFPFFFGLMVGDWGYGLVILLMSLWIIHRLDHPVKHSRIPKVLSNFVFMIMKPGSLKVVARALIPGSLVGIGAGIVFNSFFGFNLLPFTLYNPMNNIGKLLLFSGYIGIAMVTFGLLLGIMDENARGHRRGVVGKIGWLFITWGISITGLMLIYHSFNFNNIFGLPTIALAVLFAGIALVGATEKSQGLMELPSIISHVLSYLRIIGILLASIILSTVIDLIFHKGLVKSPVFAVIGIIILVVGQIFNLAIAVFEPGIQGARLLFVEFFSKFYKGNGKPFRPFSSRRKYTIPDHNLKEE
ncbi:MAG: V-type ATP synthase subunit I [Thermoplasmataceae archaeon]